MFLVRSLLYRNTFCSKSNIRSIFTTRLLNTSEASTSGDTEDTDTSKEPIEQTSEIRDPSKDRSKQIPVETSIKYLRSEAYKETYGTQPVWFYYRRNHKGPFPPKKTRRTCIRKNVISTGNPCPICRDEYLVLSEKNPELLKQFICQHTGSVLSYQKTGLCQKRHLELLVNIKRARDRGILTFDVPFRTYDYKEYMSEKKQ